MTIPKELRNRFHIQRALALVLGLLGAAALFSWPTSPQVRLLAMVPVGAATWLLYRANIEVLRARGKTLRISTLAKKDRRRFYLQRVLALLFFATSGVILFSRSSSPRLQYIALLALGAGLYTTRRSNLSASQAAGKVVPAWTFSKAAKRVGPIAWAITAISVLACIVFVIAMYIDQIHGGREVWPVNALAVAGVAFVVSVAYVAMKFSSQ